VLVIDDDAWIRTVIAELLKDEGYTVEQAADGSTGLRMTVLIQPDIILLDLGLPMRSGLDVLLRLMAQQPTRELPVTIASAYAMLLVRGEAGRADRLMHTPFDLKELLGQVRQVVGQAHPDFPSLPPTA
jgi:DNA-binding response OmpR family regulator